MQAGFLDAHQLKYVQNVFPVSVRLPILKEGIELKRNSVEALKYEETRTSTL